MEEFTRYTLPNGIRCLHKRVRSAAAHCALTINAGSRDESGNEHGLAHLLEHALFKGTAKRKAYHVNCRLENLGGELNAYTTKEETVIHTTTLKGDAGKAAELIADIVFHSSFPPHEIEKEKEVIVDEINAYKESPTDRIYDHFEDLLFANSSLGHNILGSKRSLARYTRDDLSAFVNRTYHTDQMVFSVIGNLSEKRFRDICNRYFGDIPANPRTFTRDLPSCYVPFAQSIRRANHQAHCIMGNRAYSLQNERRITLALLTNILGGPSANSLLNMSVRERYGLSYAIEAMYTPLSNTGTATIYFGSDRDKVEQCIELITGELFRIREKKISHRLLSMAKKQFLAQMTIAMENNENYMLGAARSFLHYNHIEPIEVFRCHLLSVSSEELAQTAGEIYGEGISTLLYK